MNQSFIFEKEGFSGDNQDLLLEETLFHNANGYLGIRGNFEEGYPEGFQSVRGEYINGFYNISEMKQAEKHYGFKEQKQTMVNLFDTQGMKLFVEGEELNLFQGTVSEYKRKLDMKLGITARSFIWRSPKGKEVKIEVKRMASFSMLPLFTIEYQITPLNFSGNGALLSLHSGNVSNYFNPKDSRVAGEKIQHMHVELAEEREGGITLIKSSAIKSGLSVSSAVCHRVNADKEEYTGKHHVCDGEIQTEFAFLLSCEKTITVTKYTVMCDSLRYENSEQAALTNIKEAVSKPLSYWYGKQETYLENFWMYAVLDIEGDEQLDVSVHYNLFQLLQSAGKDSFSNIAAKGLSGEGYEGHYFWDTEMYILPFFSLTQPEIAKNLLNYRYQILDKARENAKLMGHMKGALYAWRTINGEECSGYFPSGGAQYHINGDIAYGIVQYYLITGDWEFIVSKGAEMVLETARMWLDLGHEYKGKFHIHCVTGPDEYTCMVNNNYYTNVSAMQNLLWGAKIYDMLEERGELEHLEKKIKISKEEILHFRSAARNMYIPYDENMDINPQDDSFLSKKVWDLSVLSADQFPIMHHHHLLHLYRYQVCKQADTVLAHFIFEDQEKLSTIGNSFRYYEAITTHDSSLSRCIFSIMASKLGQEEKAYEYFDFSSKLDITDAQKNTRDGIHTANMGGTYMAIVYGFLGFRVKESGYFFCPSIPRQWKSYHLRICLKGSLVDIKVTHSRVDFKLLHGEALMLSIYGKTYRLDRQCSICREGME